MLASVGATRVPMAVPPTWRKSLLLNWKLLNSRTILRRDRMEELEGSPIGILLGGRYWESQKATARRPSSFGILV